MSSNNILEKALNIPVRKNMRYPPVTAPPSESIASVMYKLVNADIGAVIVKDHGRAVGIITERDVLEHTISGGSDLYETKAKDIMSKPLVSIEADRPIKQALELMQTHNVRRLAITDKGALVGIVTERRLLTGILSEHI